jgi:hypothetical protein
MMMEKLKNGLMIGAIAFLLIGCATVKDVQRASDLIRTDNELTRLIVEVRPNDQAGASIYLSAVATHAENEAHALKEDPDKILDAIAYYRIAATAYWRSGRSEVVNNLFEVTDNGTKLCSDLGKNAPDRDCLFLQLVIPFAGLESHAKNLDISLWLEKVDFKDGDAEPEEITTMAKIGESLIQVKALVQKIFTIGEDNRYLSHPGMCEYYCKNAKEVFKHYDSRASLFVLKVEEFYENFIPNNPPLGITIDEAREIRRLKKGVPDFCH